MVDQALLKKIIDVYNDKSGSLIGDYIFNEDELDELKKHFISKAKECFDKYNYNDDDILIFIIVIINKLRDWNKEWSISGFWDQINVIFDDDYYIYTLIHSSQRNKLYNGIENVLKKYDIVLFKTNSGDRAFVQTFLYQAMAPRISLENFVNLAWKKYFDDLECEYSCPDIEFCRYIVNCLYKKITSPDEDFDIKFGSTYYKLRSAFKYGIIQNTEKTVNLLNKVLLAIDKVDKYNEDLSSDTLGSIVTKVVSYNKRVFKTFSRNNIIIRSNSIAHNFDQLRPVLYLDSSQHEKPILYIMFPRMILLNDNIDVNYVQLFVYKYVNNEKILLKSFTKRPIKNNGEGSYTMSAFAEDLTELYNNEYETFDFEFILRGDNGKEYISHKEFFRNYLLFNGEKEIKRKPKTGLYTIVVLKFFDVHNHLKQINKNGNNIRNLWKNIWIINCEENDSIEYLNSFTLFSARGMPSNVRFEDDKILPYEYIKVLKDSETYDLYKDFCNLYINNNDSSIPEHIRIIHKITDLNGSLIYEDEKRLSQLKIINHRYFYSADENYLKEEGFHSLEVVKIVSNNANKYILNKRYIVDKTALRKNKNIPYNKGNYLGKVVFFSKTYEYECVNTNEYSELWIEDLNLTLLIQNPFICWQFGSNNNEIHFSSLNLNRPIIRNQIKSTNETIIIKNNMNINKVFFESNVFHDIVEVSKSSDDTFLLSQFLNRNTNDGMLFVDANGERLSLFSITYKPYLLNFKTIQDCLELTGDGLLINFSDYFIHDDSFYILKLQLEDYNGNLIEINDINPDEEMLYNDCRITDGYYNASLSYTKIYAGEKFPAFNFPEEEVELGDLNKLCFSDYDRLYLNNFRTFELNSSKISCREFYIENIKFFDYSNDGDCVFTGILKSRSSKPQKIKFTHKDGRVIKDFLFIYDNDNLIIKKANYDTVNSCFTTKQVGENIVEFKTIYYR